MTGHDDLAAAIRGGDRNALARAITLVESRRAQDTAAAEELLQQLLPATGKSLRVGITGAPGVGKSTLIEALGGKLCAAGHQVAVLAVDPSSSRTGGSILGDKTRMSELSRNPNAFIRPSPGGDTLGGVAARTREAMLLCEAAGFDIVLIETIGTGQSEVAVHGMVDFFLLLLSPAAGDELQGIKRGVMELADGVLVHKADGDLAAAADRAAQQCSVALHVLHSGDATPPPVSTGSSLTDHGIDEMWSAIVNRLTARRQSGELAARRTAQAKDWLEAAVRERLLSALLDDPQVAAAMDEARLQVERGELLPAAAARKIGGDEAHVSASIRLAVATDFDAIAAITNHYIRTSAVHFGYQEVGAEELRRLWREYEDRYPWLVSERKGEIAGYAKAGVYRSRDAYSWITETGIYLAPSCCGQGLGRPLYERLLDVLRAQGFHSAIGGITLPNDASVRLHENLGFRAVGTLREAGRKFDRWHDFGFWQLLLQPSSSVPANPRTPAQAWSCGDD